MSESIQYGSLAKADDNDCDYGYDIQTAAKWATIHQVIMVLEDGHDNKCWQRVDLAKHLKCKATAVSAYSEAIAP